MADRADQEGCLGRSPDSPLADIIESGHQGVFVSTASAWDVGMVAQHKSSQFLLGPKVWFENFMAKDGVRPAPLTPAIAIDSIYLPEPLHVDPGDRLLIATARHLGFLIVTRDRKIEAYPELGHVAVIRC